VQYNWSFVVYGPVTEELPIDQPIPRSKIMRNITYQDAKLYHDLVTGRAMYGIIHFFNQTPISSYCKKQQTVKTSTYGSKLMVLNSWLRTKHVSKSLTYVILFA
jgi:uncharacterized protein YbbC (DUF1343 family)